MANGEQDGRRTSQEGKSYKRRLIGAIAAGLPMDRAVDYADREPIGEDAPPKRIILDDGWIDKLGVEYEREQYEFVVENGELGLERVEND